MILINTRRELGRAPGFYYYNIVCIFLQILKSLGLQKTASSAVNLLIDIGFFPVHVNLDLLKLNIQTNYSDDIVSEAENLLAESSDTDEV